MRTSSQGSTSCGRQKLLDCSLSTPTLLHHDIAGGDDVRMSAGLLATPDKTPCEVCERTLCPRTGRSDSALIQINLDNIPYNDIIINL